MIKPCKRALAGDSLPACGLRPLYPLFTRTCCTFGISVVALPFGLVCNMPILNSLIVGGDLPEILARPGAVFVSYV